MKINNYVWENDLSLNDLVLTQKEEIERLNKELEKYKYSADELNEIERLNTKEEQLIRRLEDLIIVGEQVENEWAVDICKMIIEELKGSDIE